MSPMSPSDMKTSQFEAVKIAIKQDKTGYVLTLNIHPDDVPDEILRDFVGARYQVVMVRLGEDERPQNRDQFKDAVRQAGILCRDKNFAKWLIDTGYIFEESENEAVEWLKSELSIETRAELRTNDLARGRFWEIYEEFREWKRND